MPYLPMPLPLPYGESKGFWAGCKRHELLIERCMDYHAYRHPPIPVCPECQSWKKEWVKVAFEDITPDITLYYFKKVEY